MSEPPAPRRSRRTLLVVVALVLVAAGFAVPRIIGSSPTSEDAPPPPAVPAPPAAPPAPAPAPEASPKPPAPAAAPIEKADAPAATSKDGDLAVSMKFRWSRFETGDRVLAKVAFVNHTPHDVYLPAAGEPSQGLAVVVQNQDGDEVRRVVETAKGDQIPRRVAKVGPGLRLEIPVVVVAEDEAPLAPGTYSAYAEFRPDPRLARLGLPLWKAEKGPVRSEPAPLVVTAKAK